MPSSRKDDRRNAWRGPVETGRPSIPKGIAQDAGGLRASQAPAADPIAAASHIISGFIQRGGHHAGETGSLREELIGAWELVSYVVREVAGGEELYPFGDTAGLIMYPDGFMSAQMMGRGRPEFASGSCFDASDDELRAAASGYIAYSGPFHVD
jgi:Lipocalin-like domain